MINFRHPVKEHEYIVKNALSQSSLNALETYINFNKKIAFNKAKVIGEESRFRDSNIMWIPTDEKLVFDVYQELIGTLLKVNQRVYNFNLTSLETLQYAEYDVDGHFTWHCDGDLKSNTNNSRKLSFSLLLSDDYEGGDLELFYGPEPKKIPIKKNQMVFFPSTTLHRVTPVVKGVRKSLVGWIHGPDFV
jgi:PKHD-type hydroxylase